MLKLIKGAQVYAPESLGDQNILISGGKICVIDPDIKITGNVRLEIIEVKNKLIFPGFVDSHAHFLGGGGEGGLTTRNSEIKAIDFVNSGVTTAIGCIGVDGTTRDIRSLLTKAKALETEGITSYIYTATSFEYPFQTVTGSIRSDMILLDKVIGAGEIPIGDWRSPYHNSNDLKRIVVDTVVGASLAGKSGIVHFHIGDNPNGFRMLKEVCRQTGISLNKLVVTHVNRNEKILREAISFALEGGNLDITAGLRKETANGAINPEEAIKTIIESNISTNQVSISSDGNGNVLMEENHITKIFLMPVNYIMKAFQNAHLIGLAIEKILPVFCTSSAKLLGLTGKGEIKPGADADLIILDRHLRLEGVMTKGIFLKKNFAKPN